MSAIETNEIFNPTNPKSLPLQVIKETEIGQTMVLANTNYMPSSDVMSDPSNLQMNPKTFAAKERRFASINWDIANTKGTTIYNQDITPALIDQANPHPNDFAFINTDIKFSFKPDNNAFFQGLYRIFYDPAPADSYYNLFGNSLNLVKSFELPGVNVSACTSEVEELYIPKMYPFQFYNNSNPTAAQAIYQSAYPLGRLKAVVVSPLTTTSGLAVMPTMINISFPNYAYGGTQV